MTAINFHKFNHTIVTFGNKAILREMKTVV